MISMGNIDWKLISVYTKNIILIKKLTTMNKKNLGQHKYEW